MPYQRDYLIHLRVFEPVEVYAHAHRGAVPHRAGVEELVCADADRRLISMPPDPVPSRFRDAPLFLTGEEAGDNRDRVCPVQEDIRGWQALDILAETTPRDELDVLVPKVARRRAHARRVDWMNSEVDERVFTRTSAWEVPPIWWLAVDPDTDTVVEEDQPDGAVRVRIRTELLTASARTEWALDILRNKSQAEFFTESVSDFLEWLDSFDMGSILELDLGGMSDVQWPETGAQLVLDWLDALDSDDMESARIAFDTFTEEWERRTLYAHCS